MSKRDKTVNCMALKLYEFYFIFLYLIFIVIDNFPRVSCIKTVITLKATHFLPEICFSVKN